MAQANQRSSTGSSTSRSQTAGKKGSTQDAIALLKADHRQVEKWFEQFEKSESGAKKSELAEQICAALRVHATIEEEIFYPAFLEAVGDEDLHHEAEVEHESAKHLIGQIEESGPEDDHFDAKVKVLSEMIKHHVKEEEKPDGMFAKAKESEMDLDDLGQQMVARKTELEGAEGSADGEDDDQ